MEYAIDTQILTHPNSGDVIRELAFTALNDDSSPIVLYFKPSTLWRKDNYDLADLRFKFCRHVFSWSNDNVYDFTQIGKTLQDALKDATRLVVIGEEKKLWFERFNFNVMDIFYEYYPFFYDSKQVALCIYDGLYKTDCALYNVKRMKQFYCKDLNMEWKDILFAVGE